MFNHQSPVGRGNFLRACFPLGCPAGYVRLDPPVQAPCDEAAAGELRHVVRMNSLRRSGFGDDLFQHADHTHAAERGIGLQRQALAP